MNGTTYLMPHVIPTASEIHDFKEDEEWGVVPELESSFDEVGDYKHQVIVQHLAYFHRQDGNTVEDSIVQCVLDSQTFKEPIFYNAHQTNFVA
jgi:hypothetical protein